MYSGKLLDRRDLVLLSGAIFSLPRVRTDEVPPPGVEASQWSGCPAMRSAPRQWRWSWKSWPGEGS